MSTPVLCGVIGPMTASEARSHMEYPRGYKRLVLDYASACQGKIKHRRTKAIAEARRLTQRSTSKGGQPVRAYACPHCRAWHCGREKRVKA